MVSYCTILIGIAVAYLTWSFQSFLTNYRNTRQSGFPILVCPANTDNVLWIIFAVALRPFLARYLPHFLYDRVKPAIYGWEFLYRYEVFERLGPSFILVTPGRNELWVADPETAHSIVMRRNDFLQFDIASRIVGMFGPNLITSDGGDWQRQRRMIAPLLNERISKSVWDESSRQADEMLDSFTAALSASQETGSNKTGVGETDFTISGLRAIAINVIGAVGYGKQQSWNHKSAEAPAGYRLSYMEAILSIVENLIYSAFVPIRILTSPVMPKSLQRIGWAVQDFPRHVEDILAAERNSDRPSQANLMSTLITASDAETKSKSKLFLSENELTGNLFQFTIAGFDTTANSMAYAITMLAIHPEWQAWIQEEIDEVVPKNGLEYDQTYPALKRTLALMFEILRLYTPIAHISRSTKTPQSITVSTRTYQVPANTTVFISVACMHSSSAIWGADALTFRPTRWLLADGSFLQPPRSSFLPWSAGPRVCPGMKMAEVEFVAVMLTIFRSFKATPVLEKGESMEMACERLKGVVADSTPRVTLQMNRPKDVKLRWERR